jgi:hypothetical protein
LVKIRKVNYRIVLIKIITSKPSYVFKNNNFHSMTIKH